MGVATDAIVCYGISFEEGYKFPWDGRDIEDWWIDDVLKWEPLYKIYNDLGKPLEGLTRKDLDFYFKSRIKFKNENPLPVELIRHCSDGYPMYIVAVPSTVITAHRGFPEELDIEHFDLSNHDIESFMEFCDRFNIFKEDPKWWLCSYWESI